MLSEENGSSELRGMPLHKCRSFCGCWCEPQDRRCRMLNFNRLAPHAERNQMKPLLGPTILNASALLITLGPPACGSGSLMPSVADSTTFSYLQGSPRH